VTPATPVPTRNRKRAKAMASLQGRRLQHPACLARALWVVPSVARRHRTENFSIPTVHSHAAATIAQRNPKKAGHSDECHKGDYAR
jgi:hypothetical protein